MRIICEQKSCTGCSLCAAMCPVSCITMKAGKLGHLFPVIDKKKCINCGLCIKNCPTLKPVELSAPKKAYAAWSKDESDYRSSTSGGASSVLSQYIIRHGGVVYGCAVLPGAKIEHIRIDKIEDLYRIKESKYVQSSITESLRLIKKDIKDKKTVLFIGTPCQIAAVKNLFKILPDNLYLIDLVCHGTPSQKSLQNYLKRQVSLDTIDNIRFRSEEGFIIKGFSNNQIIYQSPELWSCRYKDYYYNAFMDGFSYRDSCYHCRYASPNRCSDITIGDFWGLGKEVSCDQIPEHEYGISLLLPITKKGETLFQKVAKSMNVYERPISEAINGNDQLRHPKERTKMANLYRVCQPVLGDKNAYYFVIGLMKHYSKIRKIFKR